MIRSDFTAAALGTAILVAGAFPAGAQDACNPGKPGSELTGEEAQAVYDCIADELNAGYLQGEKKDFPEEFVQEYRDWSQASKLPAAPGFHGGRFLLTWVNPTGFDAYVQYAEDPTIPSGTVIAKESFSVGDDGSVQHGPLFIMQKVEQGRSPETQDWFYMAVAPNGSPMGIDVMTACNECHVGNFGHQGGLGYPVEEARLDH